MKKMLIVPVIALGFVIFAGCSQVQDEMARFRDAYARTREAVTVTEEIEVLRDDLAVYLFEQEYRKTNSGYAMTYTERRLNKVDENTQEPYTVTTGSDTVSVAETFNPALTLDLSAFQYGYEIQPDSFRGELCEGMEDHVFGFTGSHAEMKQVVLALALDGSALKEITVNFNSGSYSVSIVLTFTYSA